jgi:hypothetical protein
MPKMKVYLVVVIWLCLGLGAPAEAECWRWVAKTIPEPQWQSANEEYLMAYAENIGELVLFTYDKTDARAREVNLWIYRGTSWELLWKGGPEMDPGWYFGPAWGLVYDQNLKALVLFANIFYQLPSMNCEAAFKFVPNLGWERILDCFYLTGSAEEAWRWTATYDTRRKRAIIIGAGQDTGYPDIGVPITVEFDGWTLSTIYNPPEYTLHYGSAGYDPGTGKTVFFGLGRVFEEGDVLETFEYDGTTWRLVETSQRPYTEEGPVAGLVYVPAAGGLIAVPSYSREYLQTWLYIDSDWRQIPLEVKMPDRMDGILGYDEGRGKAIYWGGDVKTGKGVTKSHDTLEFASFSHCRQVNKP